MRNFYLTIQGTCLVACVLAIIASILDGTVHYHSTGQWLHPLWYMAIAVVSLTIGFAVDKRIPKH